MRVGLLHFGQSVDFVVSISFLRSPVLAILAIGGISPSWGVSAHTHLGAGGFNGAVMARLADQDLQESGLADFSLHEEQRQTFFHRLVHEQTDGQEPFRDGKVFFNSAIGLGQGEANSQSDWASARKYLQIQPSPGLRLVPRGAGIGTPKRNGAPPLPIPIQS